MGLLVVSSVSIFGIGAILQASAFLFMLVKMIGASYLIYLGIRKYKSKEVFFAVANQELYPKVSASLPKFREEFLVAATNPKAILFFVVKK